MIQSKTAQSDQDGLLGQVVDEFFDRLSRGENPEIEEYAQRHPEIAELIRNGLPALQLVSDSPSEFGSTRQGIGDTAPKQLGDFHIGRELGRGGMGVVYEAEQISMGRTVALKVLPFAAVMDEKAITRFKNEARAAGTLHHENIVPVHAVGNERGVYYYAMALIEGLTLAQVIEELRQRVLGNRQDTTRQILVDEIVSYGRSGSESPSRNSGPYDATAEACGTPDLDASAAGPETVCQLQVAISTHRSSFDQRYFQQVTRLAIEAADALQHAHEHGIVHRDIKPGNLMVDPSGKLWITDFGLARIESETGMTISGDLLGTLRYMSPEQALAKRVVVDHRADIYSLGVTLYELLTLSPAYDGSDREQLLRQIAFEEPKKIGRLNRAVPRDLETIVLKAISKNPNERYCSAAEMADDLRAYLDNKPIKAKPPTMAQRSTKWVMRHTALVTSAAVILMLATIGLSVSNLLISHQRDIAEHQRDRADQQTNLAMQEAARADAEAENAKDQVAVAKAVLEFIKTDLLGAADPHAQPNRDLKVREVLERAAKTIGGSFPDQPLVEAAIRSTLGISFTSLGEYEEAENHLRASLRLYHQEFGMDRRDSLRVESSLAWVYHNQGKFELSRQVLEELLRRSRRKLGHEDALTVASMSQLADVYRHLGRKDEAKKLYAEVLEINSRLLGPNHLSTLEAMNNLERMSQDLAERVKSLTKILEVSHRVLGPDHPSTLTRMNNLAVLLRSRGRYSEAEGHLRRAWLTQRRVLGPEHHDTILSEQNLATVVGGQGRFSEAEELLIKALDVSERVLGSDHPRTVAILNDLGVTLDALGRYADAEKRFNQLVAKKSRLRGAEHPSTLLSMCNLAKVFDRQGRYRESEEVHRRVLEARSRQLGLDHPDTLQSKFCVAGALFDRSRYADAEALYRDVIEDYSRVLGAEHPKTLLAKHGRAATAGAQGRYSEAEELLSELLEIQGRILGSQHRNVLAVQDNLAYSIACQGRYDEAETLLIDVLTRQRDQLGPQHPSTLATTRKLAKVLSWQGSNDDAEVLYRKVIQGLDARAANEPAAREGLVESYVGVAKAQRAADKTLAASATAEKALDLLMLIPEEHRTVKECGYLGQALYFVGRSKEARDAYQKEIERRGDDGPTLHNGPRWWYLTLALAQLGETKQARSIYDDLVEQLKDTTAGYPVDEVRREAARLLNIVKEDAAPQRKSEQST